MAEQADLITNNSLRFDSTFHLAEGVLVWTNGMQIDFFFGSRFHGDCSWRVDLDKVLGEAR